MGRGEAVWCSSYTNETSHVQFLGRFNPPVSLVSPLPLLVRCDGTSPLSQGEAPCRSFGNVGKATRKGKLGENKFP